MVDQFQSLRSHVIEKERSHGIDPISINLIISCTLGNHCQLHSINTSNNFIFSLFWDKQLHFVYNTSTSALNVGLLGTVQLDLNLTLASAVHACFFDSFRVFL